MIRDVLPLFILFLQGGMQDWNYLHSNCFEITVEVGCQKYPFAKDLQSYWVANEYSLLVFMAQVMNIRCLYL